MVDDNVIMNLDIAFKIDNGEWYNLLQDESNDEYSDKEDLDTLIILNSETFEIDVTRVLDKIETELYKIKETYKIYK